MKKLIMMVLASLFLAGAASTANAFVLVGTSGTGSLTGAVLSLPALPDYSVSYNFDLSSGTTLGTITQNVYLNQTNSGVTGSLFTYKITRYPNVGEDLGLGRFSTRNFAETYTIVADYATNDSGTVNPSSISRTSGGTLYFDWALTDIMADGDVSNLFFVQTDIPYVKEGQFSLLGDGVNNFYGYAPSATPEPATVALFGSGLLGLLGFRRKKTV